jgi:uncharacterized protein with HEPN domain
MYPRDQASLLDIVKAAQSILAFVSGMTLEDFTADVKTQSAVLYQIATTISRVQSAVFNP